MRVQPAFTILALSATVALPAAANTVPVAQVATTSLISGDRADSGFVGKAPGHLECVPYARTTSGIQIYGDAHTWWDQARGRYATGREPQVGSVMAIKPYANSRLGHVATVSRIVDSRTILLSHANWSVPGEIERNVTALDVSPENDWSEVRIWYAPRRGLGTTHWPVSGFIYNAKPGAKPDSGSTRLAKAEEVAPTRNRRVRDPIGEIIAGIY